MVPRFPRRRGGRLNRVLVTGATGYVGSRLVRDLSDRPDTWVRALVRRSTDWLVCDDQIVDDLSDPKRLDEVCEGISSIVHLAGSNEVVAAGSPEEALLSTALGTHRVAAAAASAGVRTFIYLSTVHVYGRAMKPGATITEDTPPEPTALYGIARLTAEHLARESAHDSMDVVILRLTNSIGAPAHPTVERWTLVANDLCRQAVLTGELRLRSDGNQWRDFVPLAEVLRLLAEATEGALPGGTYNMASGFSTSVRELAEIVQQQMEIAAGERPPLHVPGVSGEPTAPYTVCADKLASAGYRLSRDITGAVGETLRFCLDRRDQLCR